MTILPLPGRHLELHNRIIRLEDTEYNPLLDESGDRSEDLLTICSWCKQVKADENRWLDSDELIRETDLFASSQLPKLTHGMCPTCFDMVRKAIADHKTP